MIRRFAFVAVLLAGIVLITGANTSFARRAFATSQNPCYPVLLDRAGREGDILLFGSSRMLTGVDPDRLPGRAFNLAHNDRSYLTDRLLFDEVTRVHRPSVVIVEAYVPSAAMFAIERPAGFRRGASDVALASGDHDRLAIAFGRYDDLSVPGEAKLTRWRDRMVVATAKIDQFAGQVLSGRLPWTLLAGRRRFEISGDNVCRPRRREVPGREIDVRGRYVAAFAPAHPGDWSSWAPDRPGFLRDPAEASARRDLSAIATLARRRGIAISFLYLPSKFVPPPDVRFQQAFAAQIGAPLLVPSRQILLSLQSGGYADEAHLNAAGRRRVSQWLARELRQASDAP